MNLISLVAVFLGGGLGSVCRFAISRAVIASSYPLRFPLATLLSNVLACGAMVVVIYITSRHRSISDYWSVFWLIGFCGGFSTFSTFSYENWLLYREASYWILLLNVLLSLALCFIIFLMVGKIFSVSGG